MAAFVPTSGLSSISGKTVANHRQALLPLRRRTPTSLISRTRMTSYPYTGSGYGTAGVPYGGDRLGQSFKATSTADIVQTAASVPIFKTLVSLLIETGLDYELSKGGPFTVFAPNDDAFAALLDPHGFRVLGSLLRPENRAELRKVLEYHVIPGEITSAAVLAAGNVTVNTPAGVPLTVHGANRKVNAGSARVIKPDIPCTNGVIHIINSVLVPPNFVPQPVPSAQKPAFDSIVSDVYGRLLSPRQALGIDAAPVAGALKSFN